MGKQSNLTIEQRTAAALSLIRKEEPAAKIARRHGISEPTLYRDRDLFLEGGKAGIASGAGKSDARGKKIDWRDECRAIWCILKYSLARNARK